MVVFSVFDSKANAFMKPFFAVNRQVALRSFGSAANNPDHDFHRFATDFTLMELGTFDESNGFLEVLEAPKSLALAATLVQETE